MVRGGKPKDATALAASISDPEAAKLDEWALLRQFDSEAGFDRYVAFMRANPNWPSMPLLRRRAEVRLWRERRPGPPPRGVPAPAPTGGRAPAVFAPPPTGRSGAPGALAGGAPRAPSPPICP